MKLVFFLIAGTFIVAVIFCLWLNSANEPKEKKHEKNIKRLSKPLMPNRYNHSRTYIFGYG